MSQLGRLGPLSHHATVRSSYGSTRTDGETANILIDAGFETCAIRWPCHFAQARN